MKTKSKIVVAKAVTTTSHIKTLFIIIVCFAVTCTAPGYAELSDSMSPTSILQKEQETIIRTATKIILSESGIIVKLGLEYNAKTGDIIALCNLEVLAAPSNMHDISIVDSVCSSQCAVIHIRYYLPEGLPFADTVYCYKNMLSMNGYMRGEVIALGENCFTVKKEGYGMNETECFTFFVDEETDIYSKRGYENPFAEIETGMMVEVTFPYEMENQSEILAQESRYLKAIKVDYWY